MNPTFEQARRYGFVFPHARMWATPENRARIAQDAALITTPNTTVPAELLAYIDPMVIEILTAPRRAREIFGEEKKRHDFGRELGMADPRAVRLSDVHHLRRF